MAAAADRTRRTAGSNERYDIAAIIHHINNDTPFGQRLKSSFHDFFHKNIVSAREPTKTQNRRRHYDIELVLEDDSIICVEHKGCKNNKPIPDSQRPWDAGVQFYNGTGSKFAMAHLYAQKWFEAYIEPNVFSKEYGITADTPTYDTWSEDAFRQKPPKCSYVQQFKSNYRRKHGSGKSPLHLRTAFNPLFTHTLNSNPDIVKKTIGDCEKYTKESLKVKDAWLTVHGNAITGEAHIKWFKPFQVKEIKSFEYDDTKSDLEWNIEAIAYYKDNPDETFTLKYKAKLRWGSGCGYTNIRVDLG